MNKRKNYAEKQFQDRAEQNGWNVTKKGYPDFFCWKDTGELILTAFYNERICQKRYSLLYVVT